MPRRVIDCVVRKVGNSLVITIPFRYAERFRIKKGSRVEIVITKKEWEGFKRKNGRGG